MTQASPDSSVQVAIQYQQAQTIFGSQFVVNAAEDEVLVDVSAGVVLTPAGQPELPIHTRLAMTWSGARRLSQLLQQALKGHDTPRQNVPKPKFLAAEARLPEIEVANVDAT